MMFFLTKGTSTDANLKAKQRTAFMTFSTKLVCQTTTRIWFIPQSESQDAWTQHYRPMCRCRHTRGARVSMWYIDSDGGDPILPSAVTQHRNGPSLEGSPDLQVWTPTRLSLSLSHTHQNNPEHISQWSVEPKQRRPVMPQSPFSIYSSTRVLLQTH